MQLALHADFQGGRRGSDCTAVGYYLFSLAKFPARAQVQTMYVCTSRAAGRTLGLKTKNQPISE
jgi:hypothetical protein